MSAFKKMIGKAKLTVHVDGCAECGTQHAPGWTVLKVVLVTVATGSGATTEAEIPVYICAGCWARRAAEDAAQTKLPFA